MPGRKALDAGDAKPAARQLAQRCAAHRAEPHHDHVELRHRPNPIVSEAFIV